MRDSGKQPHMPTAFGPSPMERTILFVLPTLSALGPLLPALPGLFAFRIAVALLLVVVLANRSLTLKNSPLARSTIALLAAGAMSSTVLVIAHGLTSTGASELVSAAFGLLLLTSVVLVRADAQVLRSLVGGWLVAFAVTGALALQELRTGWRAPNYLLNRDSASVLTDTGAASSLGNPNDYAYFLLASLLVFVAAFSCTRRRLLRISFLVAIALIPALILATGSSLGLLGLGILALALLASRSAVVTICAAPWLVAVILIATTTPNFTSLVANNTAFDQGATGTVRLNLLLNGLKFSLETGFLGLGPGGFEARVAAAQVGDYPTYGILSPHSALIEILSQYGAIVLIFAAILVLRLLIVGWRAARDLSSPKGDRFVGFTLVMFSAMIPVMSIMMSSTLDPSHTWMAFAVALAAGRHLEDRSHAGALRISVGTPSREGDDRSSLRSDFTDDDRLVEPPFAKAARVRRTHEL